MCLTLALNSSCNNQEDQPSKTVAHISTSLQDDNISSLLEDSGLIELKRNVGTWNEFHENYLQTVITYKNHDYLHSYKSNLINHQILNTSILKDINAENFEVLEIYLEDLKHFKSAYPQVNYLILDKIKPFINEDLVKSLAKHSYEKGMNQKQEREDQVNMVLESDIDVEFKREHEKNYIENYIEYLPKLQELFISNN